MSRCFWIEGGIFVISGGSMEIAPIDFERFALLLRGWRDSGSRLRVAFKSSALEFFAFCAIIDARDDLIGFWIGDEAAKNAVEFKVHRCLFAFRDVPATEASLPLGVEMESAIEAVRDDFALLIMLLK
jgi:hypothetical protein